VPESRTIRWVSTRIGQVSQEAEIEEAIEGAEEAGHLKVRPRYEIAWRENLSLHLFQQQSSDLSSPSFSIFSPRSTITSLSPLPSSTSKCASLLVGSSKCVKWSNPKDRHFSPTRIFYPFPSKNVCGKLGTTGRSGRSLSSPSSNFPLFCLRASLHLFAPHPSPFRPLCRSRPLIKGFRRTNWLLCSSLVTGLLIHSTWTLSWSARVSWVRDWVGGRPGWCALFLSSFPLFHSDLRLSE